MQYCTVRDAEETGRMLVMMGYYHDVGQASMENRTPRRLVTGLSSAAFMCQFTRSQVETRRNRLKKVKRYYNNGSMPSTAV